MNSIKNLKNGIYRKILLWRIVRFSSLLNEIKIILATSHESRWEKFVQGIITDIQSQDSEAFNRYIHAYAGMGSYNDLVITCENKKKFKKYNDKFDRLKKESWNIASKLLHAEKNDPLQLSKAIESYAIRNEARITKFIAKNIKKMKIGIGVSIFSIFALLAIVDRKVDVETNNQNFSNIQMVSHNKVGLLLGTSKFLKSGKINRYFEYRIRAAEALYKAGKIEYIVVSGDNSSKNYNEPEDMKNELIKCGIPETKIFLDYAGFRTFDSVYRLKYIFDQNEFTIISQKFHNQRAIYIANSLQLNAIGYNAQEVDAYNGFLTKVREKFARVKLLIDLSLNKKPKFLGNKIAIQ